MLHKNFPVGVNIKYIGATQRWSLNFWLGVDNDFSTVSYPDFKEHVWSVWTLSCLDVWHLNYFESKSTST